MIGCVWFVAWMLLVHDYPSEHPRISKAERDFIEKSIGVKEVHKGVIYNSEKYKLFEYYLINVLDS